MKVPVDVILDTDIGTDIDDTWALAMMLNCPELNVRLIVSDFGDTVYQARIIAKLLQEAGRTDIPIGVGSLQEQKGGPRAAWVGEYDLSVYPGVVHWDGVAAIIETIMRSSTLVTLFTTGQVRNIAEALRREPRIS